MFQFSAFLVQKIRIVALITICRIDLENAQGSLCCGAGAKLMSASYVGP